MTPKTITLELTFEHPEYVMLSPHVDDNLSLVFKDTYWIKSLNNNGLNTMNNGFVIPDVGLPKQKKEEDFGARM